MKKIALLTAVVALVVLAVAGEAAACHRGGCGCWGGGYSHGCWGGHGGGCYGGGCYGGCGYAGWGGGYGHGCYGGYASYGWGYGGYAGGYPYAGYASSGYATMPTQSVVENKATLIVTLPADAKLTIEGTPTTATSGRRVFLSPPLEAGKEYVYNLKAEAMINGKPTEVTRAVTVRANESTNVDLQFAATPTTTE